MTVRPYEPGDRAALWELKAAFERELGATGPEGKEAAYEAKLTDDYRERYLAWVEWCTDRDPRCVLVADPADGNVDPGNGDADSGNADAHPGDRNADAPTGDADVPTTGTATDADGLAGYVFVLPEELAPIWDAAVVNEVYVRPARRGTGLADELMGAALDAVREQDLPLDRVVLDVDRGNERARAFYDRWGFTHWGEMVARDL